MTVTRAQVLTALESVPLPDGAPLGTSDLVRALVVEDGMVRFVIDVIDPTAAPQLARTRAQAEAAVAALPGVRRVSVALTAHGPSRGTAQGVSRGAPSGAAPQAKPQESGPQAIAGVERIIAVGSGKGGVGKSTVASNLAVALAREGWRVGLLDADLHGPSQPHMMGVSRRPLSADGNTMIPLEAHGVRMISIGVLVGDGDAVMWRGAMLTGALRQLLTQVQWGVLDALLIDMPPGTGDIQMTLCSKFQVAGALVVSTPQDVALLDARKALRAFQSLKTPVLGLIENMSTFVCPKCGHEEHIFGEGGVEAEAARLGLPVLGSLPLSVDVRLASDGGVPVAATDSATAAPYRRIARRLIETCAA